MNATDSLPAAPRDFLAEHFGNEVLQARHRKVDEFWNGHGRYLVSITTGKHGYRQQRNDADILPLFRQNLQAQSQVPGCNIPSFFPDFGTISLPKFWGGNVQWPKDTNIYIEPVTQDVETALKLKPAAVDDPAMDAARAVRLFRSACDLLGTDQLPMRTPDMQGPLNTAGLIVNQEEMMMTMHENPDLVHALLDRTTDFIIELVTYLRRQTSDKLCGNIWPYTHYPITRGLAFTEDIMPLVSADLYKTFAVPYLKRLDQTFGPMLIHCCGDWGRHAPTFANAGLRLAGAEFHYPFTRIEELLPLADNTVFIPYIALDKQTNFSSTTAYYRHLLDSTKGRCRFWFAWYDDTEEARKFVAEMGESA